MKNLFLLIFSFSLLASCSTEEMGRQEDLVGVWEQKGFLEDSGHRLVLAQDHTGIHIYREVHDDNAVTSSAVDIHWENMEGNNLRILEGLDVFEDVILTINPEGQLVAENQAILPFEKISNTTLDYY